MIAVVSSVLAQASEWVSPTIDWHALAPEIVLVIGINIVLLLDLQLPDSKKWAMASIT